MLRHESCFPPKTYIRRKRARTASLFTKINTIQHRLSLKRKTRHPPLPNEGQRGAPELASPAEGFSNQGHYILSVTPSETMGARPTVNSRAALRTDKPPGPAGCSTQKGSQSYNLAQRFPGMSSSPAHGGALTREIVTQCRATQPSRLLRSRRYPKVIFRGKDPLQNVVFCNDDSLGRLPQWKSITRDAVFRSVGRRQRSSYQVQLRGQPGQICPVTRASLAGRGWISERSLRQAGCRPSGSYKGTRNALPPRPGSTAHLLIAAAQARLNAMPSSMHSSRSSASHS